MNKTPDKRTLKEKEPDRGFYLCLIVGVQSSDRGFYLCLIVGVQFIS